MVGSGEAGLGLVRCGTVGCGELRSGVVWFVGKPERKAKWE